MSGFDSYDVSGDLFGTIIQSERWAGGNQYNLGSFDRIEGNKIYLKDGTWCGPISSPRETIGNFRKLIYLKEYILEKVRIYFRIWPDTCNDQMFGDHLFLRSLANVDQILIIHFFQSSIRQFLK